MIINPTPLDDMYEIEQYLLQIRFKFRADERYKLEAEDMVNKARRVIKALKEQNHD